MRIIKCGIVLILMLLLFAGCEVTPVPTTTPTTAAPTTAPTEPTFPRPEEKPLDLTEPAPYENGGRQISCQLLPETVDNPEDLPVLKWICFNTCYPDDVRLYVSYDRDTQWSEEAADEVNAMLEENGLPFRIQFMLFTNQDGKEIDWYRVPEVREAMQEADLITGPFLMAEAMRYLLPITEYISEDAPLSLSGLVPHELNWHMTTYEGEVYGLPVWNLHSTASGWHVREDIFTEYGFTAEDFQKDFVSMDEVFAELYERNGNQAFLDYSGESVVSTLRQGVAIYWPGGMCSEIRDRFQYIGSCYAVDYSGEKPVVVNYLETEYVRRMQEKMVEYARKGYFCEENDVQAPISYGNCYSVYPYQLDTDYNGTLLMIPVESSSCQIGNNSTAITGILKNTKNRDLVLQLLNKMGEDGEFHKQLIFGVEGTDYEVVDGEYVPICRQDGSYNMEFLSGLRAYFGISYETYGVSDILQPHVEGMTQLEVYQASIDQSQIWPPVAFNWSQMRQETSVIQGILTRYLQMLPMVSPDTYETILTRIRDAGGDRIKQELQRQLDEWFAENPEWLEMCSLNKTDN